MAVLTSPDYPTPRMRLRGLSRFILAALILSLGLFVRNRPDTQEPGVDWVVLTQLAAATLAGLAGVVLILRYRRVGVGAGLLILYVLAMAISIPMSPHSGSVIGYWYLIANVALFLIGVTAGLRSDDDVRAFERIWLAVALFVVFADSIQSMFFTDPDAIVWRLGMGSIHASVLAYMALYVMTMTTRVVLLRSRAATILARLALIGVIALTRTRAPLVLAIGLFMFQMNIFQRGRRLAWVILGTGLIAVTFLYLVLLGIDVPAVRTFNNWLNRDDTATLTNLTGRDVIWRNTLSILNENHERLLYGYGYGVTRLVLNAKYPSEYYVPSHTHNDLLEVVFGFGLPGLFVYLMMLAYSLRWLWALRLGARAPDADILMRAALVMLVLYVDLVLGIPLGGKVSVNSILILFYILLLDRRRDLLRLK